MRTSHTCNSTDPRPNILFLQADDFARATISAYQSHLAPIVKTPHIDKLAAEGAIFDRSFVTNSLCAPSRTVILTGLHSHENGVIHITNSADQNGVCEGCKQKFEMAKGVVAYPQMLRGAGYATALFGKYHSHDFAWGARAFEHFRPVERHVYWDPKLCRAGNKLKCDAQPTKGFETEILSSHAIEWLREHVRSQRCSPFYLEVDFKATHEAWQHPKKYGSWYRHDTFAEPASLQHRWGEGADDAPAVKEAARQANQRHIAIMDLKMGPEAKYRCSQCDRNQPVERIGKEILEKKKWDAHNAVERRRAVYQAYIQEYARTTAALDAAVGSIMSAVDSADLRLRDRTVVVFCADQGFFLGEHGRTDKRLMYEESLFFPLVVRYPPEIRPRSRPPAMVLNLDVAPTLLDYARVTDHPNQRLMLGRSLRRALRTNSTPAGWREGMYYRYLSHSGKNGLAGHLGVRTHRHKLIFWYSHKCTRSRDASRHIVQRLLDDEAHLTPPEITEDTMVYGAHTSWELFDLDKDPHELSNVYMRDEYRSIRCEMTRTLLRLKNEARDLDETHCPEAMHPEKQPWTRGGVRLRDLCAGQLGPPPPPPAPAPKPKA